MPIVAAVTPKILHPECYTEFCVKPERVVKKGMLRRGPLVVADAKKLLKWETEAEYEKRKGEKFPDTLPIPIFEDVDGNRVVCWANAHNRPFEREWALARAQDILTGSWRFNMENLIVSKYGTILSAQHRLVALVFAYQLWSGKQKLHWQSVSAQQPCIETIIAYGCEETPDVLQTLDNCRPRSESDVIYTSNLFADLNHYQRKECSRMHAAAIDLLWKRTGAGKNSDVFNKYKTNATALDFADRHKRLAECVRHIFTCNKQRNISILNLSPGQCAAMQYMMAAQSTDRDTYANGSRCEADIDFSFWEQAKYFWSLIGNNEEALKPLYDGLKLLVDPSEGDKNKGRAIEKITLIALAWNVWINNGRQALIESDVLSREGGYLHPKLEYSQDRTTLLEPESFGGIDEGVKAAKHVTAQEIEQRKEEVKNGKAKPVESVQEGPLETVIVNGKISDTARAEAERRRRLIASDVGKLGRKP